MVNHKRVYRLHRLQGLALWRRTRKRAAGLRVLPPAVPSGARPSARGCRSPHFQRRAFPPRSSRLLPSPTCVLRKAKPAAKLGGHAHALRRVVLRKGTPREHPAERDSKPICRRRRTQGAGPPPGGGTPYGGASGPPLRPARLRRAPRRFDAFLLRRLRVPCQRRLACAPRSFFARKLAPAREPALPAVGRPSRRCHRRYSIRLSRH